MNQIKKTLYSVKYFAKRNAPTILTWASALSTAAALYFTGKATVQAVRRYDQLRAEDEGVTKKQILKTVIPYYIPAAGFATASIACSFSSNHINVKRQRVLSAALLASNEALRSFKQKAIDKIGEEGVRQITEAQAQDSNVVKPVTYLSEEIIRVYDEFAQYKFETTMTRLIDAETEVNRQLNNPAWALGIMPYENFYNMLHVVPPKSAKLYTWNAYTLECGFECTWIDFYHEEVKDKDGTKMIILRFSLDPEFSNDYKRTKDND